MSATSFARVPHDVYDALERGEITLLQFTILAVMHRAADWKTGIVASWSAKEYFHRCGETKPTEADERNVQRAQAELRERGWYRDTYKKGSKKPYLVTLHNFVVYGPCADPDGDKISDNDQDSYVLNPYDIAHYTTIVTDTDREDDQRQDGDVDGDRQRQMSAKDHIGTQPSASSQSSPAAPSSGQIKTDGTEAAAQLREIIGWVPDNAPKTLSRLLQTFSFEEIAAWFRPFTDFTIGYTDTKDIAAAFAKGGAKMEAGLRWTRKTAEEKQLVDGLENIGVDRELARSVVRKQGTKKILADMPGHTAKTLKAVAKPKE